MSTYVELEIQELLGQGEGLDKVAQHLIQNIESSPELFSLDNINALARFLSQSKQDGQLVSFILKHIENENFHIPWPYFLESLGNLKIDFEERTINALIEGIEEDGAQSEASRAQTMNDVLTSMGEWRSNRKYKIHKDYINNKKSLLEQLITLRTQQLYEGESALLKRLLKLYPGDKEILNEAQDHKQRHALEILARRAPKSPSFKSEEYDPKDPAVEEALEVVSVSLLENTMENPEMAFDFAMVAFVFESYDAALEILEYCEDSESLWWFRLEVLLHARRFVELLNEIAKVEVALAHEPETFFATAYLRAQALWGLGQKHTAIEVMESLLSSRPHYRSASTLLSLWSGQ